MSNSSGTVLITGANRGLGLEFARQLSEGGWRVYGTVRAQADLTEAQRELGDGCTLVKADVTDDAPWADIAKQVGALDLLINNAGTNGPTADSSGVSRQVFGHYDFAAWRNVLDVNLIGQLRVTQAMMGPLRAGQGKQIVFVSSLLGSITKAGRDKMFYRTSKAALNMAGAVIAQALESEGFRVGAICPGWVRTRMGGEEATLSPSEAVKKAIANFERMQVGEFVLRGDDGQVIPW